MFQYETLQALVSVLCHKDRFPIDACSDLEKQLFFLIFFFFTVVKEVIF